MHLNGRWGGHSTSLPPPNCVSHSNTRFKRQGQQRVLSCPNRQINNNKNKDLRIFFSSFNRERKSFPLFSGIAALCRSSYTTCTSGVGRMARASEIKFVREVEEVNWRNLLSDLKSRYGSYYTVQFACFLACFMMLCQLYRLISNWQISLLSLAKRTEYITLNVTIYVRKEKRSPNQVYGWTYKLKETPCVSSYIRN